MDVDAVTPLLDGSVSADQVVEVVSEGTAAIRNLGREGLAFLAAVVVIIPLFRSLNISPVLGYLLAGVILKQTGSFANDSEIAELSELGILFLLFEMGLELSFDRLKAMSKFAFGLGIPQVLLCTAAFTLFTPHLAELIAGVARSNTPLARFFSDNELLQIRSLDQALVVGAALAQSSSAFVLQLHSEKGTLATRFGSATLGVLLLQDIAVVPLLVLLPLIEDVGGSSADMSDVLKRMSEGGGTALAALLGLGGIMFGGRLVLRRVFELVAESRSADVFVALSLLTVTGTAVLTQALGFSDTLGAFVAGVLLAETTYRTQVEADIRPFRGLLLGLFFVTTGTSIDLKLLQAEWPTVLALLGGLIVIKSTIIAALGPLVGLTRAESVRTGVLLSQGGEFAFILLALAQQLGVLPLSLDKLLIIVVVFSMALTPALDELGTRASTLIEAWEKGQEDDEAEARTAMAAMPTTGGGQPTPGTPQLPGASAGGRPPVVAAAEIRDDAVVLCNFGSVEQVVANAMGSPLALSYSYVAFDLNPKRVKAARQMGFPVLFGDGTRPEVLKAAGVTRPRALVLGTGNERDVARLREVFSGAQIYARARDLRHAIELRAAGADGTVSDKAESGLSLAASLLEGFGLMEREVISLKREIRRELEGRAMETAEAEKVAAAAGGGQVTLDAVAAQASDLLLYAVNSQSMRCDLPRRAGGTADAVGAAGAGAVAAAAAAAESSAKAVGVSGSLRVSFERPPADAFAAAALLSQSALDGGMGGVVLGGTVVASRRPGGAGPSDEDDLPGASDDLEMEAMFGAGNGRDGGRATDGGNGDHALAMAAAAIAQAEEAAAVVTGLSLTGLSAVGSTAYAGAGGAAESRAAEALAYGSATGGTAAAAATAAAMASEGVVYCPLPAHEGPLDASPKRSGLESVTVAVTDGNDGGAAVVEVTLELEGGPGHQPGGGGSAERGASYEVTVTVAGGDAGEGEAVQRLAPPEPMVVLAGVPISSGRVEIEEMDMEMS